MTVPAITGVPEEPLGQPVRRMREHRIGSVPIVQKRSSSVPCRFGTWFI